MVVYFFDLCFVLGVGGSGAGGGGTHGRVKDKCVKDSWTFKMYLDVLHAESLFDKVCRCRCRCGYGCVQVWVWVWVWCGCG